jgi:hypothetical protein
MFGGQESTNFICQARSMTKFRPENYYARF